jgi:hemerythrin
MIYSKFESVPCCVFKHGSLLKYNDKFKSEFENVLDFLLARLPSFTNLKDTLVVDKKVYNVYIIHESDDDQIVYVFFDITDLAEVLTDKDTLNISDLGISCVPNSGINIIDDQHSEIINLIEEANNNYNQKLPLEEIIKLLFKIIDKTSFHFKTEEVLMKKYGIDNNEESISHIKDHDKLLSQIEVMINQLSFNNFNKVVNYLRYWFLDHIVEHDLILGKKLFQKGYIN